MPIELKSITHQKLDDEDILTLDSDCIKLSIYIKDRSYGSKYAHLMKVQLDTGEGLREFCTIDSCSSDMVYKADEYYLCNRMNSYDCFGKSNNIKTTLGYLMLLSLEFELDGNPEKIKDNQFSKDPKICF